MTVLVTGRTGMLGHVMVETLSRCWSVTAWGRAEVDLRDGARVSRMVRKLEPDVIVNCAGLIPQCRPAPDNAALVNTVLPHVLVRAAASYGGRVIHFSTDCVFDGKRGGYTEDDTPNSTDLYGRTKVLGELTCRNSVTIRTSMIGPELNGHRRGLYAWLLSERGHVVKGYRRAVFSGLPTVELARLTADIIDNRPDLSGLYHVASEAVNKFDLLCLIRKHKGLDVNITPDDSVAHDRSLNAAKFRAATGYTARPWAELVELL